MKHRIIRNEHQIDLDEMRNAIIETAKSERLLPNTLDYGKITKLKVENDYEFSALKTDHIIVGKNTRRCHCVICNAPGFTFTYNTKTKQYYCSHCKKSGKFQYTYDKTNPTQPTGITFEF